MWAILGSDPNSDGCLSPHKEDSLLLNWAIKAFQRRAGAVLRIRARFHVLSRAVKARWRLSRGVSLAVGCNVPLAAYYKNFGLRPCSPRRLQRA